MNNAINKNQHYITRSFVKKRFGTNGFVQRYDVENDSWKTNASPRFVFSGPGYTQFLEKGQPLHDSLETSFGNLENQLQFILPALDGAAERAETKFPEDVYHNLCFYCSYLWYLSPFAKAKAPANLVLDLESNLRDGNLHCLQQRGWPEDDIRSMKAQYDMGYHFILQGENYLQFVFRDQFVRKCQCQAAIFRYKTKWTVYNSHAELPISDIALVDFPESATVTLYILPISPNRVLVGRFVQGSPPPYHSTDTIVYGSTLTVESAEDVLDVVSGSAVKTIACKNRMDIKTFRERAKSKGRAFSKISNLDDVLSAGSKVFDRQKDLRLVPVSKDEYINYVHSFIGPAQT
jgi:hypothetical protein